MQKSLVCVCGETMIMAKNYNNSSCPVFWKQSYDEL